MRLLQVLAIIPTVAASALAVDLLPAPETPKIPILTEYHGVNVTYDYRWLEDSASPSVKDWSNAQNRRTRAWLDALPNLPAVRSRIDYLIRSSSVAYVVQVQRGGRLFALKVDPRRQQPILVTLADADDLKTEQTIVDPNALDAHGAITIDWFVVSLDGRTVGVSLSRGGSEEGDLHLYDVATGKGVGEMIPHVQNGTAGGSIAFTPDGKGFWYTRYPRGQEHAPEDAGFFQQVWFHRIGTKTEDDVYELGKGLPKIAEIALEAKEDGQWILAEVKNGDGGEVAYYLRSTAAGAGWTQITTFADKVVHSAFGVDNAVYLMARAGAARGKILRLPLTGAPALATATVIVPESDGAIQDFVPTRSRLYVNDLLGGPSRVRIVGLDGKLQGNLPLLPVSSVREIVRLDGDDVLFANTSY